QAEDGIRDATVTGVQTCALPIYTFRSSLFHLAQSIARFRRALKRLSSKPWPKTPLNATRKLKPYPPLTGKHCNPNRPVQMPTERSEERRVGKECRSWWTRDSKIE